MERFAVKKIVTETTVALLTDISNCINRLGWGPYNYIYPEVTKMGSVTGHKIDHRGVGF